MSSAVPGSLTPDDRSRHEEIPMSVLLNPYIGFQGQAREAMDFYRSVFGGELTTSTYGEGGMAQDPADQDKIMHSQLQAPGGLVLMGSDNPTGMPADEGQRITISLSGDDEAKLRGYWDALVEGGTATMPLEKAPWGDSFGMLADRYGVNWMVNISGAAAGQ
jgi:PhnB protein